jgi:hypothetical protein
MQISESIKDLYRRLIAIQQAASEAQEGAETLKVDDVVSKVSLFYEKLRNTMDYQEDHLLRRYAIERNLRRRVLLETLKPDVALSLVEELIRSGYLPNNSIPETVVQPVATCINKYTYLIELVHDEIKDAKERRTIMRWIVGVMACEIDLVFQPESRVDALIETLYAIVRDRIKYKGKTLTDREKNIQLYVTLHKELVKSDDPIISYHLLNLYFPDWSHADKRLVEFIASKISSVYHGIEVHLSNPIRPKIAKSLKKQIVAFKILRELITLHADNLVDLFGNPTFFEAEAQHAIERTNKAIRKKLRGSSIRAIAYIFITKVLLAIVLEYPYDRYIVGQVNQFALTINILVPPIIMFLVTLSARLPGATNTKTILKELNAIVYGEENQQILCELKLRHKTGPWYFFFEYLFYILLYGLIFGALIWVLDSLHFNILSGGIFLFFLTAVSFFGTRIRQLAQEYNVELKREGFRQLVVIFISLPIIRAGQWLSVNMRRINLFAFILDFIIEAPFKLLLEMIEGWFAFLREKREDTFKTN